MTQVTTPYIFPPDSRTELIRRMKRFQVANQACLMIKYAKDNRYDKNGVATHDRCIPPPLPGVELVTVSLSVQAGDFSCGCH